MAAAKAQQLADVRKRVRDAFIVFEHRENSRMTDMK
jgi:hypothetical protein